MANVFWNPFAVGLILICLVLTNIEAIHFRNSYIQNVKSGRCLTLNNDVALYPLSANKCKCDAYQFWKLENRDQIKSEFAFNGYVDELGGYPDNGKTVGGYVHSGLEWQTWTLDKDNDGNYVFTNKHTKKCLTETAVDKIVQYDCEDDDQKQKWKIIENPCGKLPDIINDRFQLQNPATGKCAVIKDNSDIDFAALVGHECSCDNEHHYFKFDQQRLISEGKTKKCIADWDDNPVYAGITQCVCDLLPRHLWKLSPIQDGNFNLVNLFNGKCAYLGDSAKNTPLQFEDCNPYDPEQRWRFYDQCSPEPLPPAPTPPSPTPTPNLPPQQTNVIPQYQNYYFGSGSMNWLTPAKYQMLYGGRWDSVNNIYYTANGQQIIPGTQSWNIYFGQNVQPSLLNGLFSNGQKWNDVFGWMTGDFFNSWTPPKSQCSEDVYVPYTYTTG